MNHLDIIPLFFSNKNDIYIYTRREKNVQADTIDLIEIKNGDDLALIEEDLDRGQIGRVTDRVRVNLTRRICPLAK